MVLELLSAGFDFGSDVHIWAFAIYVVGIEFVFVAASQDMAFAALLTVVEATPFVTHELQTFFPG